MIGVWTGPEQKSFQAVIDGFTAKNPDATVKYTSGGDNIVTVLSTAVEGGNPPDIATVSQPGTMADFVERGALKPLDFAKDAVQENFGDSIVTTGSVDGTLYGLLFKAANKSTIWYNVSRSTTPASRRRTTWDDLLTDAKTINQSGILAGGGEGGLQRRHGVAAGALRRTGGEVVVARRRGGGRGASAHRDGQAEQARSAVSIPGLSDGAGLGPGPGLTRARRCGPPLRRFGLVPISNHSS